MKITNFTDFKNEIVNKGKTFIFKIEYDNPSDGSIPAPLKLQRTPRGVDIDYAIPNNHSMIYKYEHEIRFTINVTKDTDKVRSL